MYSFIQHAMPMYTHDQSAYVKQMCDWHMKMTQYHDQLRAYHVERTKYFQKLFEERAKTTENPTDGSAA
ncbi:hypothetical protein [Ferviditalea candida]|uniref:Uncharacterized protein n=1 Tax=Ferviditalea candida TaxID=3108399 RepID=A0ABU5ZLP0_9BACL|nr:hypothetical protein [Paenibacillaceae bacterium T2]